VLTPLQGAFTVTTKLESQEVGCRLNFGTNGSIISEVQVARTTGTTVTVTNLFEALPVRRGEFLRSIKKQYQKMIKVLQSYAIIAVGVRILVTNAGKVCVLINIMGYLSPELCFSFLDRFVSCYHREFHL
jgi:DNA mismatch repair protein PMS2